MMVQHYIFGYGSLICSHSRAVTASSDAAQPAAIPVKVSGLERVWSKRSAKLGMTAVGIRFAQDASTVGVLVPVTEADLARFDVREQGYSRVALSLDDGATWARVASVEEEVGASLRFHYPTLHQYGFGPNTSGPLHLPHQYIDRSHFSPHFSYCSSMTCCPWPAAARTTHCPHFPSHPAISQSAPHPAPHRSSPYPTPQPAPQPTQQTQ